MPCLYHLYPLYPHGPGTWDNQYPMEKVMVFILKESAGNDNLFKTSSPKGNDAHLRALGSRYYACP